MTKDGSILDVSVVPDFGVQVLVKEQGVKHESNAPISTRRQKQSVQIRRKRSDIVTSEFELTRVDTGHNQVQFSYTKRETKGERDAAIIKQNSASN